MTFWDYYKGKDKLCDSPDFAWNIILMKGGKFPDAPHMGVVYKQKDKTLKLAHYCGGEIEKLRLRGGYEGQNDIEKNFAYTEFQYINLGY